LCTKCSKELKNEEKKDEQAKKKKAAAPRGRRRQTESDRLMGDVKPGAKSLVDICVRRVANVVHDIEEFGDMPQNLLDRLSQILSKQRVLTPRVLELFLRQDLDRISIYDCGKLEQEDFKKCFAYMPNVETVNLRFAGQLKDDALLYMTDKCKRIRHLQLGATNLVSDKAWIEMFRVLGPQLETLKLSELNDSMREDAVKELAQNCRGLKRLKLRSCSHMTEQSIESLCALTKLEHLTLSIAQPETSAATLVKLVSSLGPNLRTLCLEDYIELDDTVLETIKNHCPRLVKLRIRGSSVCSDAAFASLFDNNCPFPPLVYADFSENRDIDNMNPEGPTENPIGFGSSALTALMVHSGTRLEHLNLKSCRHISRAALGDTFDGAKQYPALREMDLSFMTQVDDVVMAGVFKSCPAVAKLAVFACFNAREAAIPSGIAVVGLPNAHNRVVVGDGLQWDF
jgi:DNA repair protein RAD7